VIYQVTQPQVVGGQRAAGLHLDGPGIGGAARLLLAWTQDRRSPRLRLHGLIERIPQSDRYRGTDAGLRVALFFTKVHSRILRHALSLVFGGCPKAPNRTNGTAIA
jgi:hypothetical protein